MRVIAGRLGGRRLEAPPGRDTRPTPDRVREAVYSTLGADVVDAVVLDLYAGSGALGIEALSRGAAAAVFVESDRRAAGVIQRNLEALGLRAPVHRTTARRFCAAPTGGPFDLVLCDPPYATPLPEIFDRLADLRAADALAPGALIVVERDRRATGDAEDVPSWLASRASRTYGDTVVLYFEVSEEDP